MQLHFTYSRLRKIDFASQMFDIYCLKCDVIITEEIELGYKLMSLKSSVIIKEKFVDFVISKFEINQQELFIIFSRAVVNSIAL